MFIVPNLFLREEFVNVTTKDRGLIESSCFLPKQYNLRTELSSILTSYCLAIDCWNFLNSTVAISLLFTKSDSGMLYAIILFCLDYQSFSWFIKIKGSWVFLLADSVSSVWFSSDLFVEDCWLNFFFHRKLSYLLIYQVRFW